MRTFDSMRVLLLAAIVLILGGTASTAFVPARHSQRISLAASASIPRSGMKDSNRPNPALLPATLIASTSPLFHRAVVGRRGPSQKSRAARRALLLLPALRCLLAPLPALATAANPATTLFSGIRRPKHAVRPLVIVAATIIAVASVRDAILTRRRQAADATSEWGRYADKPAARGRALMALCMRITPYLVAARLLKMLPGSKGKKAAGDKSDSVESTNWFGRKASALSSESGNMFADGLLRLGPLYIKMGQILSCRENLLPEEWIRPMEILQDRVPAKSGAEALALVHEAMPGGKEAFEATFEAFDDIPLAAASLGQVHRAKIRGKDEMVAIKIQRSRLRDIYDRDLALMHKIASGVDKFGGMIGNVGGVGQSWNEIFSDAEVILYREIDYRDEADNAAGFAADFGIGLGGTKIESNSTSTDGEPLPSAADWLRTPYTYQDLSSEKILVMEYVPSIKITDTKALSEAGVTEDDKEDLAESLARSYLRQLCANRFFSTDPHPGNLGVEAREGLPPRLVFYDFGQACSLSEEQAGGILDVIEGIVDMDAKNCVNAFSRMGVLKEGADLEKVERKVRNNFETGKVKVNQRKAGLNAKVRRNPRAKLVLENKEKVEAESIATNGAESNNTTYADTASEATTKSPTKSEDLEVMSFFTLPAEYAFVARAISQMDGVGKGLDGEFDFISASAPYLVEVKGATNYMMDEAKKKISNLFQLKK